MDKIKTKIELLLAKAERTDNEHERDAYTAKAERLMLEWGIEAADLEARGEIKPEEIVEERRTYDGTLAVTMPRFASEVAWGMGNLRILKTGTRNRWHVYVIGHKTDVDHFLTLLDSLVAQVHTARVRWWKTAPERAYLSGWEASKAQREFIWAFGSAVGLRLHAQRKDVQQEATPGAALVLVNKQERVNAAIAEKYPVLKAARSLEGSWAGGMAGHAAGLKASLGEKAIGDKRGELA